ncbi:histidine kinase dimerization/phospho-acceptor domain-containing protein [Candidatus Auribacterota bacterium]
MTNWNKTILCVDDEESIIESYQEILGGKENEENNELVSLTAGLKELYKEISDPEIVEKKKHIDNDITDYNLIFARSGEEAVELAKTVKDGGGEIAIGFFDMRLGGKLDGLDVIREIKSFMPDILCSVVTAYTDRTREQIGVLFENQDEWIYFNKPFTRGELLQTACNLVSSWNLRRERKEYLDNLSKLIQSSSELESYNLLNSEELNRNILKNILKFIGIKDGFLLKLNKKDDSLNFETGEGVFKKKNPLTESKDLSKSLSKILTKSEIEEKENFLILPINVLKEHYGIVTSTASLDKQQKDLLRVLLKNAGSVIGNSCLSKEAIEREKERGEAAVNALKKIASTLCHHINNPLAIIKGFAEISERDTKNKEAKANIITIEKSADVIHGIVELLTNMSKEEVDKTISTALGIQLIDIENEVIRIKNDVEAKYKQKS